MPCRGQKTGGTHSWTHCWGRAGGRCLIQSVGGHNLILTNHTFQTQNLETANQKLVCGDHHHELDSSIQREPGIHSCSINHQTSSRCRISVWFVTRHPTPTLSPGTLHTRTRMSSPTVSLNPSGDSWLLSPDVAESQEYPPAVLWFGTVFAMF